MLFYEACSLVLCLIGSVLYHSAGEDERVCDRSGGAAFFDTAHRAGCSAASVINKAPKAYAFRALSYRNTIDFRTPQPKNHDVRNDPSIFTEAFLYHQPLQAVATYDSLSAPSFG